MSLFFVYYPILFIRQKEGSKGNLGSLYHKTKMSTSTYTFDNYSVILSFDGDRNIYIKLTDKVNFMVYEANLTGSDFPKDLFGPSMADRFTIMSKCFGQEKAYSVATSIINGSIKIKFTGVFDNFLRIGFDIYLKEKILSNDGQLTMNFNRIEQRQELINQSLVERCETLDKRCNALEAQLEKQSKEFYQILDQLDVILFPASTIGCQSQFPIAMPKISCESLDINQAAMGQLRFENLSSFYKLRRLIIRNFSLPNLERMKNYIVTDLELHSSCKSFTSLKGFDNLPNLTSLTIINATGLTNVVAKLKSAPHKIKTFKFQGCGGINVVEMQTYCQENKFFVAFS